MIIRCNHKLHFLVIGTRQQLHKLGPLSLHIDDHKIDPSSNARNLGAIIDISDQVWTIILTKYVKPVTIIFITSVEFQNLSKECLKTLVQAFVTLSLLYGLPKYQICKPQRVHNTAARHVSNARKYDRISPVPSNLHWLPVFYRINFKILISTFKAIHNMSPSYTSDLVRIRSRSSYHSIVLEHTKGRVLATR